MAEKRIYGTARGAQGSIMDPVTQIMQANRADSERRRLEMKDEEERLQHEAKKKELEKQISGEDEAEKAQMAQENEQLKEKIHEAEIEKVQVELGGKIDQLSESIKKGASQKSIGEQIAEIKQVAGDMGLGGSKFSEVQEALNLVEQLRPNKGLADQVKDAKELLQTFEKEKTDQLPPEITLQLKQMDRDLQIRLEEMRDGRADRDRDWKLQIRKWEEEKEIKMAQLQAEIAAKKEGNELLAQGIQRLGEVIASAKAAGAGGIAGATTSAVAREIIANVGDEGETECPSCHSVIPISGSATSVVCPTCGANYNIRRIPKSSPTANEQTEAEVGA